MQLNIKTLTSAIISLVVLFLLFQFRTVPVSQFWKGYRILYVFSEELAETDILSILEKNGCDSVISYSNQRMPLFSQIAPVQQQSEDSYLFRRNSFFSDKNNRALVFYIPEEFSSSLEKSIRELSAFQSTVAGSDGKSSFPWVAPLIALCFFFILFYFSKNKALYLCASVFPVLFAFSRPLYTVSAAVCLCIFSLFLFHKSWKRSDFLKVTLNSPYILIFILAPLLILFFSSPILAFFYVFSLLGTVSLLVMYDFYETSKENSYSFKPVFIRSARMIPTVGHLGIRLLGVLSATVFSLLIIFVVSGNVSGFSAASSMPSLPSPVSRAEAELVNLTDFINWTWASVSFPYKKIGEPSLSSPQDGEVVSITDYIEENGKIVPVDTPVFVYNAEFRENIYKSINKFDYPAIEKLLLKQGKSASFGYAKTAQVSSSEKFGTILLFILLAIPFSCGICYILGRKRYGLSI